MPTSGEGIRRQFARVAIRSFRQQNYANRRMLILNHGKTPLLHPDVAKNSHVTEVMVEWPGSLGALRNMAFRYVETPYLINWDDDDWHGEERIWKQMEQIRKTGSAASALSRYVTIDLDTKYVLVRCCTNYKCGCCGGTICHAVGKERYPTLEKGEDSEFAKLFAAAGNLSRVDNDPILYVRTCHDLNTSGRAHVMNPKPASGARPVPLALETAVRKLAAAEFGWYGKEPLKG